MQARRKLNSSLLCSAVCFDTRIQCQKAAVTSAMRLHLPAIKNDKSQTFMFLLSKSAVRIPMKSHKCTVQST